MTNEQRQNIVALSLASRKASECAGYSEMQAIAFGDLTGASIAASRAEDAYAALMSAVFDATEADERTNEWIEEPAELQKR